MEDKNWIAGAIKRPGSFREKAQRAGKSVRELAAQVQREGSRASATTKKQAVLAETLSKLRARK